MTSEINRLKRINDYKWEIPQDYKPGMKVPGLIYASENMLEIIFQDQAIEQVANVATLPGIVNYSMAMPDIHWGYGFPIGGVAATNISDGVISPGGVGYDINCGVRLLRTSLDENEIKPKLKELINHLFTNIPSGLGSEGKIKVSEKEIDQVLHYGAEWAVKAGFGTQEDLELTEENGCLRTADPDKVSIKAKTRGRPQLGTLGSGNHFLEIQVVKEIYDKTICQQLGIKETGQVLILIHTGSRGLGYQICDDYLKVMRQAIIKYQIQLPDKQLACAPVTSPEGKDYLAAMACAANFAWANRQCITHWVRDSFAKVFHKNVDTLDMKQIYDVAHNIAKLEEHEINGKKVLLCVHRKGATRSFPAGHKDIPQIYRNIGQPVFIPGDMGRYSYIAIGTEKAMKETFGSTCHGAGRMQSRGAAKKSLRGVDIAHELESKGILIKAHSMESLAEEASQAYKDVADVVNITHNAGLSKKIAKAVPLAIIKG